MLLLLHSVNYVALFKSKNIVYKIEDLKFTEIAELNVESVNISLPKYEGKNLKKKKALEAIKRTLMYICDIFEMSVVVKKMRKA
ncbi:hypothetical protein AYI70_g8132 [Smittium culicis]|uniref:Uncharacterized protein n=1 Tax=Smittium culicis TaxID=133412 RepID=A0A1R1XHD0_9FUNG|nr:hypothetical protein AYI70_g8132 [Smittium culicis]